MTAGEVELEAEDDDGFDVDLWLLKGGTVAYALGLLAWLVAFGLAVAAVWTTGATSDALAGTALLTMLLGVLFAGIGWVAVKAIPDAVEDPS